MAHQFKATNKEQQDFVTLEPDNYEALLVRTEDFDGDFGPAIKLFFHVSYEDSDGKTQVTDVSGIAGLPKDGQTLGLKSKLRIWIEAIMGNKLADGQSVDLDALIDKQPRCRLVLGIKDGKELREDGSRPQFNTILSILPLRKAGAVAPKAAPKPAPKAALVANGEEEELF